ncbi:sugar lactone lactonase YvrE/enterochelin esterase-like enzyme [Runella defluvii]|uniref:Sugar lactone lactonase YvrE/enterochelin esterase-like enzyme n=1 Tax=Runella defluvii TaxID=370973 RepID=A0A7W5ZNG4_9BACT|nr:SMP-30/gluconolactonase/LRE family protein [Runella defluvii]MBB3839950.1 sugar lactone lactonase YvrE/enterochelin esterase-like enzyme [Runella defluvii]
MKAFLIVSLFLVSFSLYSQVPEEYPVHPDAKVKEGVPKGEILKFTFENSKFFPGTWREYWVYVPAQYTPSQPACLYVNQDGIQWQAPTVFDNLIHQKAMPVTIGVFVMHGRVKAEQPEKALDRFNRSFEYDGLGDTYARFLLEELLPEVETKKTSDGRAIRLSKNGNDRAIGGSSSGAVCAFTAAWERPDAFSRVFSAIGTYVGLRGADRYATLVRKYEPKPLRIFLQDGTNDLNIYAGDWWMANQTMERALIFSGYEVQHVWGEGAHNGKHGTAIFADAMRFLWKGWPQKPNIGSTKNPMLNDILLPNEDWQLVGEGYKFAEGPAVNAKGEVFFADGDAATFWKVGTNNQVGVFAKNTGNSYGLAFSPDGKMYSSTLTTKVINAYDAGGKRTKITEGFAGNDLVVASNGNIYVTSPSSDPKVPSKVWLVRPNGQKLVVDEGLKFPNGITLSPDQTLLYVSDTRSHWVYSYSILSDGTLANKQKYYWLHAPDTADDAGADGMKTDRDGRLYVATRLGIQVCDQAGRVNAIIPTPNGDVSNLCFGGENFDVLYATCGDKVYKRKVKVKGATAWGTPNKPAPPRL